MQFSSFANQTGGSTSLAGCLGIVRAESCRLLEVAIWRDFSDLTRRALRIVAHYETEPPQVNFVAVTSFFNPVHPAHTVVGAILGIDILRPQSGYQPHPLVPKLCLGERSVPVYDLSPVLAVTEAYLSRCPFCAGCRVFEAHAEISNLDYEQEQLERMFREGRTTFYASLAIGVPRKEGCRLLMEDVGVIANGEEARGKVIAAAAKSILAAERVENQRGVGVTYEEIYVLATFSEPMIRDAAFKEASGFSPVWAQVQFMYAEPPQDIIPPGAEFVALRNMNVETWKRMLGHC